MSLGEFYSVSYFCNVEVAVERKDGALEEFALVSAGELNKEALRRHEEALVREVFPTERGIGLTVFHPSE